MSEVELTAAEKIAALRKKMAVDRQKAEELKAEVALADLQMIAELTSELGEGNVTELEVSWGPGVPVALMLVTAPSAVAWKRYEATIKPTQRGAIGDPLKAARELAAECIVYPEVDSEAYRTLVEKRPGVLQSAGAAAIKLSEAKRQAEEN